MLSKGGYPADAVICFSQGKASVRYDNGFKIPETVSKTDSSLSFIILCQFILSSAEQYLKLVAGIAYK